VIRALSENQGLIDFGLVPRALLGLLALLCGNGYIVGINQVRKRTSRRERKGRPQTVSPLRCAWILTLASPRACQQIYDISIDKVNKPFLPVASGEMTVKFAWIAVRAVTALARAPPSPARRTSQRAKPAPSCSQVLALAVGGASIVATNFGQLITARSSHAHAQSPTRTPTPAVRFLPRLTPSGARAGAIRVWPVSGHALQRASFPPEGARKTACASRQCADGSASCRSASRCRHS
jgi:hypothetical protein